MSSRKNYNRNKERQPYLYIIDSLIKYDEDFKQYDIRLSFDFTFLEESKVFFVFGKEIPKDRLANILKIQNIDQIVQIAPLPENEFDNFPNEITICPVPSYFHDKQILQSFLDKITDKLTITNRSDMITIKTESNYYSIILYQFLNNLRFQNTYTKIANLQSDLLPVIIISNIPLNFDNSTLKTAFQFYMDERVYKVKQLNLKDDSPQTYSARITFKDVDTAIRAVNMFNFSKLNDYEISAYLHIQNLDYLYEMKTWKLKVEGISDDLSSYQLFKAFSRFGKIYKALVKRKPNSQPTGFVMYFDKNDAIEVEKKVDQATLDGCKINVYRKRKIKIENFASITKEEIEDIFSDFNLLSIKIDSSNDDRRPIVILSFKSDSEASEAIELASKLNSMGMKLFADNLNNLNKSDFSEEKSLFLSGLPKNYTQKNLIDLCKVYGLLSRARVSSNAKLDCTNGYVEFDSQESAKDALEKMNGLAFDGNQVKVAPYLKRIKDQRF